MSPAISIIIPVYNAERYLRRCLDTIVKQTMSDFEVICVNDGSTDLSADILEQYANMDSRFKIYHQRNNRGVSAARQTGLDLGRGKYVIHADPDDWVEPDWLKCLYEEALRSGAGMVICDFERVYSDRRVYYCQKPLTLNAKDVLKDLLTNRLWGPCWNKLILREDINRYNLRFNMQMNLWEDLYFNSLLLTHNVKVAYVSQILYHYDSCTNPDSIVRHRKPSHVKSGMILIDNLQKRISEKEFDDCWFYLKSRVKDWIFELNDSEYDISKTYSEINDEYIGKAKKASYFDKRKYISMSIKGNPVIAHLLWKVVGRFIHAIVKYIRRVCIK